MSRRAGWTAGAILLAIYLATLAPSITWWDSGELTAAAHGLSIPHPPGVPLYVLLAWFSSRLFFFLGPAASVSVLSAICAASACGMAATLLCSAAAPQKPGSFSPSRIGRWGNLSASPCYAGGVAAGLCAGGMATVWFNATEAEVYAPALLLCAVFLSTAYRAGRGGELRWVLLTSYLILLAAPLHVVALVGAPAAILLASLSPSLQVRVDNALILTASLLLSAGLGTGNPLLLLLGALPLASFMLVRFGATNHEQTQGQPEPGASSTPSASAGGGQARIGGRVATVASVLLLTALVASAILFMLVRAGFDPSVNQGNPDNLARLVSVLAREQYDIAGLLPRQAPLWLQLGNYFQYLDWQFALGLFSGIPFSLPRSLLTIFYLALGVAGFRAVGYCDKRLQLALAALFICSSAGVVAYLNLKAGPTIGIGILESGALHEARERDYFFLVSFWCTGLLAGFGAVDLIRRWGRFHYSLALFVAAFPLMANFAAANRRSEPEASLPMHLASALLEGLPARAVMLTAGDNDSYPLWFAQEVLLLRRDVTVVTLPLLGAEWYRDELARRHGLLAQDGAGGSNEWRGMRATLGRLVRDAESLGRPIVAAVTVPAGERRMMGEGWTFTGFHFVRDAGASGAGWRDGIALDTARIAEAALKVDQGIANSLTGWVDPVSRLVALQLSCPSLIRRDSALPNYRELLDSACNFR